MRLQVLYFAAARDRAGVDREAIELPGAAASVADLARELERRHPPLAPLMPRLRFAVNQEFGEKDSKLKDGDEVALIPPVAGGSGLFRLTRDPLQLDAALALVQGPDAGGAVTFVGTVRDQSRGRRVLRLEYEAYDAMALAKLEQLGAEVQAKWPGVRIAIHHRIGVLKVGEAAVVIAAAAPHRQQAFRACEHAIERLKQDVPIWKKEVYEDGESWVGSGP